jgi:hypothetical protein
MDDLIESIKSRWRSEGISIPEGATDAQFLAFEQRFRVRMPHAMRTFYALMNGMGRSDIMDKNLISIVDIDSISPLPRHPNLVGFYVFGGFSFGLPHFAIGLNARPDALIATYNKSQSYKCICRQFDELLLMYLRDELDMVYDPHGWTD